MTQEHDFKTALADLESYQNGNYDVDLVLEDNFTAIQTALRLADRLQSNEVSKGVEKTGVDLRFIQDQRDNYKNTAMIFKAMSAQLIKEIKNDTE